MSAAHALLVHAEAPRLGHAGDGPTDSVVHFWQGTPAGHRRRTAPAARQARDRVLRGLHLRLTARHAESQRSRNER